MNLKKLLLAGIVAVMAVSCDKYADLPDGIYASVKTDKGTELLLRLDYENTPMTVGNFVALAEGTMKGELDTAFAGKKILRRTGIPSCDTRIYDTGRRPHRYRCRRPRIRIS